MYNEEYRSITPNFGGHKSLNGFGKIKDDIKIDFIFVNKYFSVKKHGIIQERRGDVFVSDHFPVVAKIMFTD